MSPLLSARSFRPIAVFFLLLVCAPFATLAQGTGAQSVDAAWVKAMKANDLEAIMKCYASDAIAWLPDMPAARGEKAIRATYEGLMSANTVKDAVLTDTVYKQNKNMSSAWGQYKLTLQPKAGGNPVVLTGRFSEVAERRGGRWVYVLDHASAEPVPPSPAAPAAAPKKS